MNVVYLGWCPTQTAYTAYSIVHIHRPGREDTLASDLKGQYIFTVVKAWLSFLRVKTTKNNHFNEASLIVMIMGTIAKHILLREAGVKNDRISFFNGDV